MKRHYYKHPMTGWGWHENPRQPSWADVTIIIGGLVVPRPAPQEPFRARLRARRHEYDGTTSATYDVLSGTPPQELTDQSSEIEELKSKVDGLRRALEEQKAIAIGQERRLSESVRIANCATWERNAARRDLEQLRARMAEAWIGGVK